LIDYKIIIGWTPSIQADLCRCPIVAGVPSSATGADAVIVWTNSSAAILACVHHSVLGHAHLIS
jgi:hypothetical protein